MSNPIENRVASGQLSTSIHRNNEYSGRFKHDLNLHLPGPGEIRLTKIGETIAGYSWDVHANELKNGVAEHLPGDNSPIEFRRENAGVAFLAYFPIDDFNSLIRVYQLKAARSWAVYFKERVSQLFRSLKNKIAGSEPLTLIITPYGVRIGSPNDEWIKAKEAVSKNRIMAELLTDRIETAKILGRMSHIIFLRGFGLSECIEGDDSRSDITMLGSRPYTEKLMENLGLSPLVASEILTDLFNPKQANIKYDSFGRVDDYKGPPYSTGEYQPFRNMRELRIFDYRLKTPKILRS